MRRRRERIRFNDFRFYTPLTTITVYGAYFLTAQRISVVIVLYEFR